MECTHTHIIAQHKGTMGWAGTPLSCAALRMRYPDIPGSGKKIVTSRSLNINKCRYWWGVGNNENIFRVSILENLKYRIMTILIRYMENHIAIGNKLKL